MLTSVSRTLSVLLAAAAIVAGATALSGASETVSVTAPLPGKADRLDTRFTGLDCSQQAWPYYDARCVKDRRETTSQAKPARVVTADRVPVTINR